MRLAKFLLILALITFLALLYVYQQTEIFRLAYSGQKSLNMFQDLLDKNTILRYNITKNASLIRISDRISGRTNFEIPNTYRLIRLASSQKGLGTTAKNYTRKQNLLSRIFAIKRQAEARTIDLSTSLKGYGE